MDDQNKYMQTGRELRALTRFFNHKISKYIFMVNDDERILYDLITRVQIQLQKEKKEILHLQLSDADAYVFGQVKIFLKENACDGLVVTNLNRLIYKYAHECIDLLNKSRDAFERFPLPIVFVINTDNLKKIIHGASDFYQLRDLPDFHFEGSGIIGTDRNRLDSSYLQSYRFEDSDLKAGLLEEQLKRSLKEQKAGKTILNDIVTPLLKIYISRSDYKKLKALFNRYVKGNESKIKDKQLLHNYYRKIAEVENIEVYAGSKGKAGLEEEIKRVNELISLWITKIKVNNHVDFYDINRVAEDLALKLLNEIYDLKLKNLNEEKRNHPGIDLGDDKKKIAYQITSQSRPRKIQECLESFVKEDKKKYSNGIRFLLLTERKPKLTGTKWQEIDPDFNPREHIVTYLDLVKKIKELYVPDRARFNRIKAILEEEVVVKGLKDGKAEVKQKQVKILSITASPGDVEGIYYEKEQDLMLDAFKSFDREEVYLDMPDPVKSTLTEIQEHLQDGKHDILHITAHGRINETGEGILCLEDHQGNLQVVTGDELMKVLVPPPRVVILSASYSAWQEPGLTPVAHSLFQAGIAAVIGMKTKISPDAAREFNVAFFQALAAGKTLKDAFAAGKEAIFKGEQQRLRENPNRKILKEDEIPQLLVREKDENLTREDFSAHRIEAPGRPPSHQFLGARYLERGFIGRRRVLREIYRAVENKEGAIVLKGPGGIGKSTLTTRVTANLSTRGYDFIVVRGETNNEQILEAISKKAVENGVKDARDIYAANLDVNEKLNRFLDRFLLRQKIVIIFDNFEVNQDEGKGGDFKQRRLKEFLWYFRDSLKHKETFLLFSTRYNLPGFETPGITGITLEIPEFSAVEFRKILLNSKALKRLPGKSLEALRQEIGGNPRALELLDRIAYTEFKKQDFDWEQLKELLPELRERVLKKKSESDDFTPLFLDRLFSYLEPAQRRILDVLSIYRNPVPGEAVIAQGVTMARHDRNRLADLSLLECLDLESGHRYYVHRLTAQYLFKQIDMETGNRYHLQAARYFEGILNEVGKKSVKHLVEARWHYIRAGEWNQAAEITFALEQYLTLHGFPQRSMELLQELDIEKLDETNQLVFYGQIGNLYKNFGEYDQAIELYKKAFEIAQNNNDQKKSSTAMQNIGAIYQEKGNYEAALIQYQKAKETFEKIGDIKGVSQCLHDIGIIYQYKGDDEAALTQYQKAKETSEKIGDIKGVSESLHQIGTIYQKKGDYDAALIQYQKTKETFEKIEDIKGVSASLHNIGMIYQDKGDYEAALTQYQKSMEIKEKIVDVPGLALSMAQMGSLLFQKKEFETALKLFIQAFQVFTKLGSPNAQKARTGIVETGKNLPREKFKEILKEFGLEDKDFKVGYQEVVRE